MPSPQTAQALITSSLRLIGAIATQETPTAAEVNDGLDCLNDLLETWSTESLSVYGAVNEVFSTVAGQGSYTIGTAGNFNTTRPVRISGAYCTYQGTDFPIDIIGQPEYDLFSLKNQQSIIPERLIYINSYPLGVILLWPVPSQIVTLTLSTDRVLTAVPTLATVLSYPPGYQLAIKYALAILLAPDYGIEPSAAIIGVGTTAKANIKRANKIKRAALFDCALTDTPVNWQTGI